MLELWFFEDAALVLLSHFLDKHLALGGKCNFAWCCFAHQIRLPSMLFALLS